MVGQHGSNIGPFQINGNGLIHGFQDLDHKSCIHGYWLLATALCVFLATTLSALGCTLAGLEKQNDMFLWLQLSFKCFWPWCWLLAWQVHMLKQHLSLRTWSIQGTFSTRCLECTKTQCTKSTCFNIALSASYTQDEVTSLNKLHVEHVHGFHIPCNSSLCHWKNKCNIYPKSPHTPLDFEKPKYFGIQKSWKTIMQAHFLMDSNVKKNLLLAICFFNLILLRFELKAAKPLTFLRSFNILSYFLAKWT